MSVSGAACGRARRDGARGARLSLHRRRRIRTAIRAGDGTCRGRHRLTGRAADAAAHLSRVRAVMLVGVRREHLRARARTRVPSSAPAAGATVQSHLRTRCTHAPEPESVQIGAGRARTRHAFRFAHARLSRPCVLSFHFLKSATATEYLHRVPAKLIFE
eukprot:5126369-Pleurochrysis_carterae.AAC.1